MRIARRRSASCAGRARKPRAGDADGRDPVAGQEVGVPLPVADERRVAAVSLPAVQLDHDPRLRKVDVDAVAADHGVHLIGLREPVARRERRPFLLPARAGRLPVGEAEDRTQLAGSPVPWTADDQRLELLEGDEPPGHPEVVDRALQLLEGQPRSVVEQGPGGARDRQAVVGRDVVGRDQAAAVDRDAREAPVRADGDVQRERPTAFDLPEGRGRGVAEARAGAGGEERPAGPVVRMCRQVSNGIDLPKHRNQVADVEPVPDGVAREPERRRADRARHALPGRTPAR